MAKYIYYIKNYFCTSYLYEKIIFYIFHYIHRALITTYEHNGAYIKNYFCSFYLYKKIIFYIFTFFITFTAHLLLHTNTTALTTRTAWRVASLTNGARTPPFLEDFAPMPAVPPASWRLCGIQCGFLMRPIMPDVPVI